MYQMKQLMRIQVRIFDLYLFVTKFLVFCNEIEVISINFMLLPHATFFYIIASVLHVKYILFRF